MMNKINALKTVMVRTTGRTSLILRKHSPEILLATGIAGMVMSTVMACKATLKVDELMTDSKDKVEKIKGAKETLKEADYSEKDYKKDLTVVYVQRGVNLAKLYGPSVLVGAASIGCILGSHNILRKRNVALIAAYKAVDQAFSDYRGRVVEEFGAEKDRLLKNGIRRETVIDEVKDENGNVIDTVESTIDVFDHTKISQYAKFFDEASPMWSKASDYNQTFLICQQNHANDMLHARGHVFLNEVYDLLGIPRTPAGTQVGWVKGNGDDYIDFGIFNEDRTKVRDFVNGYERSILLDFNVDGVIYDLI